MSKYETYANLSGNRTITLPAGSVVNQFKRIRINSYISGNLFIVGAIDPGLSSIQSNVEGAILDFLWNGTYWQTYYDSGDWISNAS